MTCNYCTPNNHGQRKALYIDRFTIQRQPYVKIKRNITKIYRDRNGKKRYFLGTNSMDLNDDEKTMTRNNGFIMKKHINFCPMCSRELMAVDGK